MISYAALGRKNKLQFILFFAHFAVTLHPESKKSMRNLTNAELAQILDKDIFHKISEAADGLSVECYVVGGYVRDLFLERPSNDIDVVVVGSGIEVASALKKMLGKRRISLCSVISEQHK